MTTSQPAGTAPIIEKRELNCDDVLWLKCALDRLERVIIASQNFAGISRMNKAAKAACILEIAEIVNGELTEKAKRHVIALCLKDLRAETKPKETARKFHRIIKPCRYCGAFGPNVEVGACPDECAECYDKRLNIPRELSIGEKVELERIARIKEAGRQAVLLGEERRERESLLAKEEEGRKTNKQICESLKKLNKMAEDVCVDQTRPEPTEDLEKRYPRPML